MRFCETALVERSLPEAWRIQMGDALRARLVPDGHFADAVDGVPALLERLSISDDGQWQFRCTLPANRRTTWGIDLAIEARTTVTHQSMNYGTCVLPGGEAVDAEVVVFRFDNDSGSSQQEALTLIGTGSTRATARELAVLAPSSWDRSLQPATSLEKLASRGDRDLFKLEGVVEFVSPDGRRSRVATSAESNRSERIFLVGSTLAQLEATVSIFKDIPEIWRRSEDGVAARVPDQSIQIRHAQRSSAWLPFNTRQLPYGVIEATIKSEFGDSRIRFAHLPKAAAVEQKALGNARSQITFSGLGQASIEAHQGSGMQIEALVAEAATTVGHHEIFLTAASAVDAPRLSVELRWPNSVALRAEIVVLIRQVGIYRPNGLPIQDRAIVTLSDLRGGFAACTSRGVLLAELREPGQAGSMHLEWRFEGRMGLALIVQEVERLFAMTDNLDASVWLTCQTGGTRGTAIDVRRYDCVLKPSPDGVRLDTRSQASLSRGPNITLDVVGKPIMFATGPEQKLGIIETGALDANLTFVQVPDGQGAWLVYARHDGRLRARPMIVGRRKAEDTSEPTQLQQIMVLASPEDRSNGLSDALRAAEIADRPPLLKEIMALIRVASGDLPLQTFDPIRILPGHIPSALRLLAMSEQQDAELLLALERELPMSWVWLPLDAWCRAFEVERKDLHLQLSLHGFAHLADSTLSGRLEALHLLEDRLAPHIAIVLRSMSLHPSATASPKIKGYFRDLDLPFHVLERAAGAQGQMLAEECFKRNDGRTWPGRPSFRETLRDLPVFIGKYTGYVHTVLDAPYVAAHIAASGLNWSLKLERQLRLCRAFDPSYFDEIMAMQLIIEWLRRSNNQNART